MNKEYFHRLSILNTNYLTRLHVEVEERETYTNSLFYIPTFFLQHSLSFLGFSFEMKGETGPT